MSSEIGESLHAELETGRRRTDMALWFALALCTYGLFCPYFIFTAMGRIETRFIYGNEASHVALARAMVEQHTFSVHDLDGYKGDRITVNGKEYSNKPPGFALLLAAAYAPFYHLALPHLKDHVIPNFLYGISALLGALSVAMVYAIAGRLGLGRRAASYAAFLFGWATIGFVYSTLLFNNIAILFCAVLSIWAAFRFAETNSILSFSLAIFAAAYGVVINYVSAVLLLPVLVYLLICLTSRRGRAPIGLALLAGAMAGALPLLFLAYYQYRCFGSPFSMSYAHNPGTYPNITPDQAFFARPIHQSLWNLLFSRAKGILYFTPALLAALPGLFIGLSSPRSRGKVLVIASFVAAYLLFWSSYRNWHGGGTFGARHILPAVPLLCVLAAICFDRLPALGRGILLLATLPSVAIHTILVLLNQNLWVQELAWQNREDPDGGQLAMLYADIIARTAAIADVPAERGGIIGSGLFTWAKGVLALIALVLVSVLLVRWLQAREGPRRFTSGAPPLEKA